MQGRLDRQKRDWWEYRYRQAPDDRVVWVQFSDDGVVRHLPQDDRVAARDIQPHRYRAGHLRDVP